MDNVRVAQTYIRKMTAVENEYLRKVRTARRELRGALLEVLDRDGVTRFGVSQMLAEIRYARINFISLGRDAAKEVRRVTSNYTSKQIESAQKAGLPTPLMQQLESSITETQRDGEEALFVSSPTWLDALEKDLEISASRLRLANADTDAIVARLLSETSKDGRASVWQLSSVASNTEEARDVWTYAGALVIAYLSNANQLVTGAEYQKQVIATIDERTTDCCLRAHGQIQPLDKPFHLTGTPRFADFVNTPPFHWNCRSTQVLYNPAFEEFGITTQELRNAAGAEIQAREETKTRVPIYPSHATSRR